MERMRLAGALLIALCIPSSFAYSYSYNKPQFTTYSSITSTQRTPTQTEHAPIKSNEEGYYYVPPQTKASQQQYQQSPQKVSSQGLPEIVTVTPAVLQAFSSSAQASQSQNLLSTNYEPPKQTQQPALSYGASQQQSITSNYAVPQQFTAYGVPSQQQQSTVTHTAPQQLQRQPTVNYEGPLQQQQQPYAAYAPPPQQPKQQQQLSQSYSAPQRQTTEAYVSPDPLPFPFYPSTFSNHPYQPLSNLFSNQLAQTYAQPNRNYGAPTTNPQPGQQYAAPKQPSHHYGLRTQPYSKQPVAANQQQSLSQSYGPPAPTHSHEASLNLQVPGGYATNRGYGGSASNTGAVDASSASPQNPIILGSSEADVFNSINPSSPDMFFFSQKDQVLYKVSRIPINDNLSNALPPTATGEGLVPVSIPSPDSSFLAGSNLTSSGSTPAPPPGNTAPMGPVAGPDSPPFRIEFEIEEETEGDDGSENQNPNLTPLGAGRVPAAIPSGDGSGQATEQFPRFALPSHLQDELEQLRRNPSVGPALQRQISQLIGNEVGGASAGRSANNVVPSSSLPENLDAATGTPGSQQRRQRKRMNFKAGGAIG